MTGVLAGAGHGDVVLFEADLHHPVPMIIATADLPRYGTVEFSHAGIVDLTNPALPLLLECRGGDTRHLVHRPLAETSATRRMLVLRPRSWSSTPIVPTSVVAVGARMRRETNAYSIGLGVVTGVTCALRLLPTYWRDPYWDLAHNAAFDIARREMSRLDFSGTCTGFVATAHSRALTPLRIVEPYQSLAALVGGAVGRAQLLVRIARDSAWLARLVGGRAEPRGEPERRSDPAPQPRDGDDGDDGDVRFDGHDDVDPAAVMRGIFGRRWSGGRQRLVRFGSGAGADVAARARVVGIIDATQELGLAADLQVAFSALDDLRLLDRGIHGPRPGEPVWEQVMPLDLLIRQLDVVGGPSIWP